jgi:hypothetical protein
MPAPYYKHTGHRERGSRIPLRNFKTSTESLGPNRTGFFARDEVVAAAVTGGRDLVILPLGTAAATKSLVYL